MIKLVFLFLIAALPAYPFTIPPEFTVTERFLALTPTFDIAAGEIPVGTATRRFFNVAGAYDLQDTESRSMGFAQVRLFTWGMVADIWDEEGYPIGRIEEEIFRIFPWAEYRIFDPGNRMIALAKMDYWGTTFQISHPLEPFRAYAKITRPFVRFFRDYWTAEVEDFHPFEDGTIDPRLLVFLAVLQSDKDNRDRFRQDVWDTLIFEQNEYEFRRFP